MSVQVSAPGVTQRGGMEPAGCTSRELFPVLGWEKLHFQHWFSHLSVLPVLLSPSLASVPGPWSYLADNFGLVKFVFLSLGFGFF